MESWAYFVNKLDSVKEGAVPSSTIAWSLPTPRLSSPSSTPIDNIPMMTAGSGGGRIKTGLRVDGNGSPVSPCRPDAAAGDGRFPSIAGGTRPGLETNKPVKESWLKISCRNFRPLTPSGGLFSGKFPDQREKVDAITGMLLYTGSSIEAEPVAA